MPQATPIMMYKIVHTGANIQFGGLKKGFWMIGYQFSILDRVGILDKYPIIRQTKLTIKILPQLKFFKI